MKTKIIALTTAAAAVLTSQAVQAGLIWCGRCHIRDWFGWLM